MNAARVLVVDDDPVIRDVVRAMLESETCAVEEAASGADALAVASRRCPDVIVLDLMMPGMDGFDVCKRIRSSQSTASTRVIMLTALDSARDRGRGMASGADAYLTKPFSAMDLLDAVETGGSRARS